MFSVMQCSGRTNCRQRITMHICIREHREVLLGAEAACVRRSLGDLGVMGAGRAVGCRLSWLAASVASGGGCWTGRGRGAMRRAGRAGRGEDRARSREALAGRRVQAEQSPSPTRDSCPMGIGRVTRPQPHKQTPRHPPPLHPRPMHVSPSAMYNNYTSVRYDVEQR